MHLILSKFIERLNRFVVKVELEGKTTCAYLPNPGRLWELLLPGRELILTKNSNGKYDFTVMAVIKGGKPVLLHTHYTNHLIKKLLLEKRIEWLKEYSLIEEEATIGESRIDFKLVNNQANREYYLEVKTCTLFGSKLAMFPDAETERGRRHLQELAGFVERGGEAGVLYVVMNPEVEFFLPAYHIDFAFTQAFLDYFDRVQQRAIAVDLSDDLTEIKSLREIQIPVQFLKKEFGDHGVYLLLIEVQERQTIPVGSLGEISFEKGYYVYVGSARRHLHRRLKRYLGEIRNKHWHIDYLLTGKVKLLKKLAIVTSEDIECEVAESIRGIADGGISHFGSSDCQCETHLFYFSNYPITSPAFIEVLNYFRLERPLPYIYQEVSQRHHNVPE